MCFAWEASINAQKDYDVIWSLGLRKVWDQSYCNKDMSKEICGKVISEAIGNQTELIYQYSTKNVSLITLLWAEGLELYQNGYLNIDTEHINIISTDSGNGFINGENNFNISNGVYYHTAMLNGFSNQLTEMVPPSRIFEQIANFIAKAKSTYYFILNVSDLKPVPLSSLAVSKIIWNDKPYTPNKEQSKEDLEYIFIYNWCQQQFHIKDKNLLNQLTELYIKYFQIPNVIDGIMDEYIGWNLGDLSDSIINSLIHTSNNQTTNYIPYLLSNTIKLNSKIIKYLNKTMADFIALKLLNQIINILPKIPQNRILFFKSHLLLQTSIIGYGFTSLRYLTDACNSIQISSKGITNYKKTLYFLNQSIINLDKIFYYERQAEQSSIAWNGLYFADQLPYTNFQTRRRQLIRLIEMIQIILQHNSYQPLISPPYASSDSFYYDFYNYQSNENFPLFYSQKYWKICNYIIHNCSCKYSYKNQDLLFSNLQIPCSCLINRNGAVIYSNNKNNEIEIYYRIHLYTIFSNSQCELYKIQYKYHTRKQWIDYSTELYMKGNQTLFVRSISKDGEELHQRSLNYYIY